MALKKSILALLLICMSSGMLVAATSDSKDKSMKSRYINELAAQEASKQEDRRAAADSESKRSSKLTSKKPRDKREFFRKP